MKIFDCFMYFDEELILDIRLNILDKHVDYFVIVESIYTHSGDNRELKFDINKFKKFKDKIIYLVYDEIPSKVERVDINDSENEKSKKYIMNAVYRENGQRNHIAKGLQGSNNEDVIIISDVDEIPNLDNLDFKKINKKIILFAQDMLYYKFNLQLPELIWTGAKACKKKDLESPQWLRNVKGRKYPFYRIDTYFSKKKFINCEIINNGGWHFTNLKTAEEIEYKLKSYLHHIEFDKNPVSKKEISEIIKNKIAIYDLSVDQRQDKFGGKKLKKYPIEKLPDFLQNNLESYKDWLD